MGGYFMRAGLIALDDVVRLPRNAKEHDLGEIDGAVRRFGFLERVVINETTGHLIAGHGRIDDLQSQKAAGRSRPKNVEVRGDGMWLVPADWVDVAESEEEAAAIALNRLVERGGWNEKQLAETLADLAVQSEEMLSGVGYDLDDVDEMLLRLADVSSFEPEIEFDDTSGDDPNFVRFKFGDHAGLVARSLYETFCDQVERVRDETGEVMLTDVLQQWLALEEKE